MTIAQNLRLIRGQWIAVAGLALLGALGAGAWSTLQTPVYRAGSELFVSASGQPSAAGDPSPDGATRARVTSYVALLTSPQVLRPVITELALRTTAEELAGRVTASSPPGTLLIDVTVTDTSPRRAADVVTAICARFPTFVAQLETPLRQTVSPVKVSITREAAVPTAQAGPQLLRYVVVGLLAGLVAGGVLAVSLGSRGPGSRGPGPRGWGAARPGAVRAVPAGRRARTAQPVAEAPIPMAVVTAPPSPGNEPGDEPGNGPDDGSDGGPDSAAPAVPAAPPVTAPADVPPVAAVPILRPPAVPLPAGTVPYAPPYAAPAATPSRPAGPAEPDFGHLLSGPWDDAAPGPVPPPPAPRELHLPRDPEQPRDLDLDLRDGAHPAERVHASRSAYPNGHGLHGYALDEHGPNGTRPANGIHPADATIGVNGVNGHGPNGHAAAGDPPTRRGRRSAPPREG